MCGSNSGQPTEPVAPLDRTCRPALQTAPPLATGQALLATVQPLATGHNPAKAGAKDKRKREKAVRGTMPTEVAAEALLPVRPVADVTQAPRAGPVLRLVPVVLTDGAHSGAEFMEAAVA